MSAGTPHAVPEICEVAGVTYTPLDGRAHVEDSGLEVFEIVRTWQRVGEDWQRLTEAYDWLPAARLRAALDFHRLNPTVVGARLERERHARVEDTWAESPQSRPSYR